MFSWAPPVTITFHIFRYFWIGCYFCFLGIWTFGCVVLILFGNEPVYCIPLGIACYVPGLCLVVWYLWPMFRVHSATLILDNQCLRFDHGNIAEIVLRLGFCGLPYWKSVGVPGRTVRIIEIPRSELQVRLTDEVWSGGGRRLILTCNGKEVEVAMNLNDAQRREIFERIQAWLQERLGKQ